MHINIVIFETSATEQVLKNTKIMIRIKKIYNPILRQRHNKASLPAVLLSLSVDIPLDYLFVDANR